MKNLLRIENIWELIENMRIKNFHPHLKPLPLLAPSNEKK
jgi:hypothetical protein